ncbi:hypothetical protein [Vibrio sp. WXL103]|uniref:hypothetical protein n=1 Tax=Vibrio sp. WXL103 TaxID=3450710 RepID=UPI003EC4E1FA
MNIEQGQFRTVVIEDNKAALRPLDSISIDTEKPLVVVKPNLVGICRSDLKELMSQVELNKYFGHEIVARVVFSNIKSIQVGDTVSYNPNIEVTKNSGFSDVVYLQGREQQLIEALPVVPGHIPLEKAVFCEPLSCAVHSVNIAKARLGVDSFGGIDIAVIGAGMSGTLIAIVAKSFGANVTIYNKSKPKLNFLESKGFGDDFNLKLISEHNNSLYDLVVPTTTFIVPSVLGFAQSITRHDGYLMLFGGTVPNELLLDTGADIDTIRRQELVHKEPGTSKDFTYIGTHGALTKDYRHAMELLSDSDTYCPVERLIVDYSDLEALPNILNALVCGDYYGKRVVKLQPAKPNARC